MKSLYTPRSRDLALEHPKSLQEDMDELREHHTGGSQTQKEKYSMIRLICGV